MYLRKEQFRTWTKLCILSKQYIKFKKNNLGVFMNRVLSNASKKLHKNIICDNQPFTIRKRHNMLHVCIGSEGCVFKKNGSCVMCNYGYSSLITQKEIQDLFSVLKDNEDSFSSILIGTYGSFFDTREIPQNIFIDILNMLKNLDMHTIIFETHYSTVSKDKLNLICDILDEKEIVIELGLESTNELILSECLNKPIDLKEFKKAVDLIHSYSQLCVSANVFLGAPFLTSEEQIIDSLQSVVWAFNNGVDNVVIFPSNIRENTLIDFLYANGHYNKISDWHLFELLYRIPVKYQSKIYLSWFGDWQDKKIKNASTIQKDNKFKKLFNEYLLVEKSNDRKKMLDQFLEDCSTNKDYKEFLDNILVKSTDNLIDRLSAEHIWIKENLNLD